MPAMDIQWQFLVPFVVGLAFIYTPFYFHKRRLEVEIKTYREIAGRNVDRNLALLNLIYLAIRTLERKGNCNNWCTFNPMKKTACNCGYRTTIDQLRAALVIK